jgi:hypothetical protein
MTPHHTPGPWAPLAPCNALTTRHVRIYADSGEVAIATWSGTEQGTDANARTIAAAPDLLAALVDLLALDSNHAYADDAGLKYWREAIHKARVAVAQAKGVKP